MEEYWIVSPNGNLEIYYLVVGKYVPDQSHMLQGHKEAAYYNAETEIILKAFPHIRMTLGEIFEGVEQQKCRIINIKQMPVEAGGRI